MKIDRATHGRCSRVLRPCAWWLHECSTRGWALVACLFLARAVCAADSPYFAIRVIDEATGRGVPMVELRTTNHVLYVTDSAGVAAFNEPGLMSGEREVYFAVRTHGYVFPKDGFGFRGVRLKPVAGGEAVIKLKRVNIAERLYRVTGGGIYHDSVLLHLPTPTKAPTLNAQVMGQDSAHTAIYGGKVFWLWGDTNRTSYPLGNFSTTCATSLLPGSGGLDPARGVDLTYYMDRDGFTRPMVNRDEVVGPGPIWLSGLTTLSDDAGRERLIAGYARVQGVGKVLERGLVVLDDEKQVFTRLSRFAADAPLFLDGHPMLVQQREGTYLYFSNGLPYNQRVLAHWRAVQTLAEYEGFTCLAPEARFAGQATKVERDGGESIVWRWKKNTPPLSRDQQEALVRAGILKRDEMWPVLRDMETGKEIKAHAASICWNEHCQRWVAVFSEIGGTSLLGETWCASGDTPIGPWCYARKVVTHDRYSFYNPVQHPYFAEEGGRRIYFEGTYTAEFSGSRDDERTPRYDYNQIMYRLDMDDSRLNLPSPVYQVISDGVRHYAMRSGIVSHGQASWSGVESVAFFALPGDRKMNGRVAVYAVQRGGKPTLSTTPPKGEAIALFYAAGDTSAPGVVPLYESQDTRGYVYSTTLPVNGDDAGATGRKPVCYVWPTSTSVLAVDPGVSPTP